MDAYKKLVTEASNRLTPLNRVQEIREELKRLRKARRAFTEYTGKSATMSSLIDTNKKIKIEGEIINRYNDAYYTVRQD